MPAQKRSFGTSAPQQKDDDSLNGAVNHNTEDTENSSDSEESSDSSDAENDEFVVVKLAEIRKEVQCPICLGIIRKTRTVMECLHRFCRECIDKSMRLGNNECPACRTHCASRRSLRDDPNYDNLIATLYPDIDKYEEEEMAYHEEERARNKQIQASMAETFERQAEALGQKRKSARLRAAANARRQGNSRNSRGRRNRRVSGHQLSDEEEGADGNDYIKLSSSDDDRSVEVKPRRYKRRGRARSSQPSSGANADAGGNDNNSEPNRHVLGAAAGLVGRTEILGWGSAGMRSSNRHGAALKGTTEKPSENNRISKLIDHLRSTKENDVLLKINVTLVSLHEEEIPSLKRPYLCCSPIFSVRHLCQYVAMQTSLEASEIEMLIVKDCQPENDSMNFRDKPAFIKPHDKELQLLEEYQTLGEIHTSFYQQNLVLAYRFKVED